MSYNNYNNVNYRGGGSNSSLTSAGGGGGSKGGSGFYSAYGSGSGIGMNESGGGSMNSMYGSMGSYGGGGGGGGSGGQSMMFMPAPSKAVHPSFTTGEGTYKLIKEIHPPLKDISKRVSRLNIKLSCYIGDKATIPQPSRGGMSSSSPSSSSSSSLSHHTNNQYSSYYNPNTNNINNLKNAADIAGITTHSTNNTPTNTSQILSTSNNSSFNNNNTNNNDGNDNNNNSMSGGKNIILPSTPEHVLYCSALFGNLYFLFNFHDVDKDKAEFEQKLQIRNTERLPSCQKINRIKSAKGYLQIAVGMDNGEVYYYETSTDTPTIFNKGGRACSARCTAIEWLPSSNTEFIASYSNGVILLINISPSAQAAMSIFSPVYPSDHPMNSRPQPSQPATSSYYNYLYGGGSNNNQNGQQQHQQQQHNQGHPHTSEIVNISANQTILHNEFFSKKAVTDICVSPSGKHLAVCALDGLLSIYEMESHQLVVAFRSYFGGFLCVDWSHDGLYLVSGGEDDYISIWSFHDKCLVARGQGHQSWVSKVKFDPYVTASNPNSSFLSSSFNQSPFNNNSSFVNSNNQNQNQNNVQQQQQQPQQQTYYRILSGGEDTRVLVWDFSKETLRKPKFNNSKSQASNTNTNNKQQTTSSKPTCSLIVDSQSRTMTPIILPIVSHRISQPVTDILLTKDFIITASDQLYIWGRPIGDPENPNRPGSISNIPPMLTPSSFSKMFND